MENGKDQRVPVLTKEEEECREEIDFSVTLDNVPRLQRALERAENGTEQMKKMVNVIEIFEEAVKRSKPAVCKYCLKKEKIDVNRQFESFPKSTALMQSIRNRSTTNKGLYNILLTHGADPMKGDEYYTPLEKAITNQDADLMTALAKAGADINDESVKNGNPLWFALHMNCIESFEHLVSLGADVNVMKNGKSLLHYLCEHHEILKAPRIVKQLVDHNIKLETVEEKRGRTPFLHACDYGRTDIMKQLIELGCNKEAVDNRKNNAIEIMVDSPHAPHHLDAVEFALKLGLEETRAIESLQNMISKVGSPMYVKMGEVFKNLK